MRIGNKKIFHLEAWVVKVMSLYKVCPASHATRSAFVADPARDSTSSTTSTWTASTSEHQPEASSSAPTRSWAGRLVFVSVHCYTRVYAVL